MPYPSAVFLEEPRRARMRAIIGGLTCLVIRGRMGDTSTQKTYESQGPSKSLVVDL